MRIMSQPDKESYLRGPDAHTYLSFALFIFLPLALLACQSDNGRNSSLQADATLTGSPSATPTPTAASTVPFDADRAFDDLRKMVEIGPRPAGSAELARTRQFIIGELQSYGLKVTTDEFKPKTPAGERDMFNITAELPGESSDVIIISSHYDTKLFKGFRFVGANDGGSSTATLLEIARVLAAGHQKPRLTYWFVFFDGEEAFCNGWDECEKPGAPDNTYGSRRYVAHLTENGELKRVRAMILLDMIGFKDLQLKRDSMGTKWLANIIWQTGRDIGYGAQFVGGEEGVGGDDHEPFLRAGIDAVDIIQLNSYPYWHTPDDTLDKISPQSLKTVGDVVLASLPRIEQRLLANRAS